MISKDKPGVSRLPAGQLAKSIGVGVALWYVGTMLVLYGGQAGWLNGTGLAAMYGAVAASGWVTVWLVKTVAGLGRSEVLPGVAIGTVAATLCDGLALNFARGLYGPNAELVLPGAGLILWGAGWILLVAIWEERRS